MPKLIWEKKLQEAVKRQQRFGWSVREKRGKVLVQRYYPDTNKKTTVALPIAWEPNQELSVLNALRNINDCMQNSGCNLKEAVEILYKDNAHKINLDWKKLIEDFKEYKNISKSSWEGNYSYFLNEIKTMMGSPNEPTTGKAILEKLDLGTNKLVHNWHRYCDELDKAALDPKTKPYAKREVIQLIHQIIKDNVLERNQNRKIEEIKDALVSRENQNTLINITEI